MSKLLISDTTKYISQTLRYGEERIPYRIFFVPQSKRKIKINVFPNGVVHVITPKNTSLNNIKNAVQKRARWIYQHLNKVKSQYAHVLPREYVSGETHYYLGRRYVLKIIRIKNIEPHAKLFRGQIQVRAKSRDPKIIKALLNDLYRKHAAKVFERRIKALALHINWLKTSPNWKMRVMKKQWGSCSPKGVLTLNPLLVKAPKECIDYVIIHEICHLKEHNHSKKYYQLLSQHSPGWETNKAKLDGMSELLLAE